MFCWCDKLWDLILQTCSTSEAAANPPCPSLGLEKHKAGVENRATINYSTAANMLRPLPEEGEFPFPPSDSLSSWTLVTFWVWTHSPPPSSTNKQFGLLLHPLRGSET